MIKFVKAALCLLITTAILSACNNHQPKPVSSTLSKTVVLVNGKKDSVINNPQKNYGNATISEPCVRCLLQVIQADSTYKQSVAAYSGLKYFINYVKTTQAQDTVSEIKATNALRVDVVDRSKNATRVSSFIYDNSVGKLYRMMNGGKTEVKGSEIGFKKIRNGCYWGGSFGKIALTTLNFIAPGSLTMHAL